MTDVIAHRGPDGEGFFHDGPVALGHRRLSIVDVAGGSQPMFNEDGKVAIVYNGEIFNHGAVRPELERAGHVYKTHCDTETLIHGYEEWGESSLSRYRGMFAFALWDGKKRELFCVRDRLGIKPFYYYFDGRIFAFASEIKALLAHPAISARFDESQLPEYLAFGYTSGERTMFAGIKKLMPGHTLRISPGDFTPRLSRYWDLPDTQNPWPDSEADLIRETRRRLEETVELRLMSDVPLGMFLSGGVDSSAIAAILRRIFPGPVKTFSVGYTEQEFSELSWARDVAERIGTEHHEVVLGRDEFFGVLPSLIWQEDEPIAWPSSIALFFVSQLASREVKVVLTGEGADEMFGGYSRYGLQLWNQKWADHWAFAPAPVRGMVRNVIAGSSLLRADHRRKLGHTFLGRENDLRSLFLANFYGAFSGSQQTRILANPALLASDAAYAGYMKYWDAGASLPALERMLYADKKTYLVELLMKQDRMSMAASIESRVPFLDHQFVEWAAQVPASLKVRGREGKYILKKAVEDLLPHDIVYRTKMGFPTPLKRWLREPAAETLYSDLRAKDSLLGEYVNQKELASLIARHRSGQEDATDRMWSLINLQTWGDIFLRGKQVPPAAMWLAAR